MNIFAIILITLIPSKTLSLEISTVIDKNKYYVHMLEKNKALSLSTLINNKTNLLYNLSIKDETFEITLGDMFLNFGRGLIIGNPKYNFFTKYQTSPRILSNSQYSFNTYYPITKGICGKIQHPLKVLGFVISGQNFSEKPSLGVLLEVSSYSALLSKIQEDIFISLNFRYNNLFNLGIVTDLEVATKINSNFAIGFGALFEWYYKKFEFALDLKITDKELISPLASKMFSIDTPQKSLILSGRLNEKNRKISLINKITESTNGVFSNEFSFFSTFNIFRNTFLNTETLKDSFQNKTFLSTYPLLDFGKVSFTLKPIFNIENKEFERLESIIKLSFPNIKLKFNIFYPLTENENYTFTSTEIRDLFGENIDIKIKNSEGLKLIASIIFTNSNIDSEGVIAISKNNIDMYGILYIRLQP